MEVRELRQKAADYRKLADVEPHDEMRDMLQRVADALEEVVDIRAKNEPRRRAEGEGARRRN
jgi:hypothetical protein